MRLRVAPIDAIWATDCPGALASYCTLRGGVSELLICDRPAYTRYKIS